MRFLVTGAGGQLGKEWIEFLKSRHADFTYYTSSELDITNPDLVKKYLDQDQPYVVINCAAYTAVDLAETETEKADLINNKAVEILATACSDRSIKLVHYSTDYVFPGSDFDRQKYPAGYLEDAPKNPINQYGRTKYLGEQVIINSGVDFLIFRVSWLCGKHGKNFVKTMLRLGKERDSINIVNDQFGVPTFCNHVVQDSLGIIESGEKGVFHLGSKGMISWYEFATKIFELKDINIKVNAIDSNSFKAASRRPNFSKLNTEKAEQILGTPPRHWVEGLKELLDFLDK